jgi:DNA repair protein RecN (Recombination protein N)
MIHWLAIKNFGLIESIEQQFDPGLTIITGETGTGKSMVIDALNVLLGGKMEDRMYRDQQQKCILEASLDASILSNEIKSALEISPAEKELVIRRELAFGKRSRSFANDGLVSLDLLKQLRNSAIDIHSQDHSYQINSREYQMQVLDLFAGTSTELEGYRESLEQYRFAIEELRKLKDQIIKDQEEIDYLNFQLNELHEANLHPEEKGKLEEEFIWLSEFERIHETLQEGVFRLDDADGSVLEQLRLLEERFSDVKKVSAEFASMWERLNSSIIELKDQLYEWQQKANQMEANPGRIEEVKDRLDEYNRLLQKYRVSEVDLLIEKRDELEKRVISIDHQDSKLNALKDQVNNLHKQVLSKGQKLHEKRISAAPKFEKKIEKNLKDLGIKHPKIMFKAEENQRIEDDGIRGIMLLFSGNPDAFPGPVDQIASGGERSRLMLVLKSILGKQLSVHSILFDEIDSGISGDVAARTGNLIEKLAQDTQVICISHLPQVAAKGTFHLKVEKQTIQGKTVISIRKLNRDDRVLEISEMISGKTHSKASRDTALELLG